MAFPKPDEPVELPDGSLVCKAHNLVVCGICTVDYSFMSDAESKEGNQKGFESINLNDPRHREWLTKFSGFMGYLPDPNHVVPDVSALFPTVFQPPSASDTPKSLFAAGLAPLPAYYKQLGRDLMPHHRFMRPGTREMIIFTDGACLRNGQADAVAGCALVYRPANEGPALIRYGTYRLRLEQRGPTGEIQPQTSNRAELRAVIAALHFREWVGEGWERLVIATDSEYIVKGATEWLQGWIRKDWKTSKKESVKNKDLWELLLKEVRRHAAMGLQVLFWAIPRALNAEADAAAKEAAELEEVPTFIKHQGIMLSTVSMNTMVIVKGALED